MFKSSSRGTAENIREVSGCLLVLGLLLSEECGKGGDVGVDLFLADCAALLTGHDEL